MAQIENQEDFYSIDGAIPAEDLFVEIFFKPFKLGIYNSPTISPIFDVSYPPMPLISSLKSSDLKIDNKV